MFKPVVKLASFSLKKTTTQEWAETLQQKQGIAAIMLLNDSSNGQNRMDLAVYHFGSTTCSSVEQDTIW